MDVAFLTIAELNRLYDKRELSPVEVTKALLDRIAAHDGNLHSFLLRHRGGGARPRRAAAERELMAGTRRGPLHGIPYALKDIIETAGIRTTGHSKLRQDHVPLPTPTSSPGSKRAAACCSASSRPGNSRSAGRAGTCRGRRR